MGSYETKKEKESSRRRLRSQCCVAFLLLVTNLGAYLLGSALPKNAKITFAENYMLKLGATQQNMEGQQQQQQELLMARLNQTQRDLISTEAELHSLKAALGTSSRISENVISELARLMDFIKSQNGSINENANDAETETAMPPELLTMVSEHKLPLGNSRLFGTDKMYSPMGHACLNLKEDLAKYMSYEPGGDCPDDENLAQSLMVRGCEPLPRRRCHTRIPQGYVEPAPFPQSMWSIPPDTSILWHPYTCKSYACLIDRKNHKEIFTDCRDCFDLDGREKKRWTKETADELNLWIDQVLQAKKKKGSIRIGLDIGGGTGTFAVRMREHNVTIITTSMNFDGPFNNFIASRGVVPMFLTISQRLPFYDNTLDIVHSMHVLSSWIPPTLLEFILFDIYRVLRPGGIFWLDRFFCLELQLQEIYQPMLERLRFQKLVWNVGRKLDRGPNFKEMYVTALLEKPLTS